MDGFSSVMRFVNQKQKKLLFRKTIQQRPLRSRRVTLRDNSLRFFAPLRVLAVELFYNQKAIPQSYAERKFFAVLCSFASLGGTIAADFFRFYFFIKFFFH